MFYLMINSQHFTKKFRDGYIGSYINAPRFLRQWTVEVVVVFEILPVPLSVFMFYRAFRHAIHD